MNRKKVTILIISGVLFVLLIVLTLVSDWVNIQMMPKVKTHALITSTSEEGYNEKWVPEECIFISSTDTEVVYLLRERQGRFRTEFYVEGIETNILERKNGKVLLDAIILAHLDELVMETNLAVSDGEAVDWLNRRAVN